VVVPGLEGIAANELQEELPGARVRRSSREGRLSLAYDGDTRRLDAVSTVLAVHAVVHIDAARPSALLGHENFATITRLSREIIHALPDGSFKTVHLSAAGAESTTLRRFTAELASELRLESADGPAHLEMALRRAEARAGWELLIRLTPKPLSARAWRVCDYPGALNATVASAMVRLTNTKADDIFLNVCCGSGTFLAERARLGSFDRAIGIDISPAAIACARRNLQFTEASGIELSLADARCLPLPAASVSAIVADLPFAMLQGDPATNRLLYPGIFSEAARVSRKDSAFALISTQRRLVGDVLSTQSADWSVSETIGLKLSFERGYITPSIYVLRRL
jgi:ubiquinone/menaquinone biosynthesis C-methylase UbiE